MKRWIGKLWMAWLLDDGHALPKWLARWITNDEVLRQHWQQQQRLVDRLQQSAATWAQQDATPIPSRSLRIASLRAPSPALPRAWAFRLGMAMSILLLLAIGVWFFDWRSSRREQLEPIAVHVSPIDEHRKVLDPKWIESASRGWKHWEQKGLEAQVAARDLLVKLDQDMLSEQKLFVSDLRSAASYFTVVLPDRTAKLVGID